MSSLSPLQAAELLGVTVKTLHRWEADGKIKSNGSRSHKNKKIVEELREVALKL